MNKNRMILSIAGGAIGLGVLVVAYLTWSAMAAKTAAIEGDDEEGTPGLEAVESKAQSLSRQAIYPSAESVKAIDANVEKIQAWESEASKFVSRGDKVFPATTPAAFKTFLVSDAKRLALLPGSGNGPMIKEDFTFGPFREYIVEGKMPAETSLAQLQRQWDDVASVIEMLSAAGVVQLTDVQFKVKEAPVEQPKANKGKSNKSSKKVKTPVVQVVEPASYTYVFAFRTRQTGFVKAVNLLGTGERFCVVDDFGFQRPVDALSSALGGEVKKQQDSAKASGRSRRGRRAAVEEVKPTEKEDKKGLVTDPSLDEPFAVTMTVTVCDFRSLEKVDNGEEVK